MLTETDVCSSTKDAVEARDLAIRKGPIRILDRVSFTLETGTFAALVGPSGCGKTSLLRVLALLDSPNRGKTLFWGQEPEAKNGILWVTGRHLYPRVTYVPQTLALWPHMTLRENIFFATPKSAEINAKFDDLCGTLEISKIVDRKPIYVSQGQRQRCALIRALLLGPEILLLDEITAALDEDLAKRVWKVLRFFAHSGGTIFASTHSGRLASACDYAHRIENQTLILDRSMAKQTSD